MTERDMADVLVAIVCHCGPKRHARGYPECSTARAAARAAIEAMDAERAYPEHALTTAIANHRAGREVWDTNGDMR